MNRASTLFAATICVALSYFSAAATAPCGPELLETENRSPYMRGVPVPRELLVTDELSWARDFERVLWSNQNVHKVLRVDPISRGSGPSTPLPYGECGLSDSSFKRANGTVGPLRTILSEMGTDGFVFVKDGAILAELYYNGFAPDKRHQLNSVSKSFVGLLAGIAHGGRYD